MANNIRYFIGNWKMFGLPKSVSILNNINKFVKTDKKFNKKYKVVIAPPNTLIQNFARLFLKQKVEIGAQNCHHKDYFGSNTGAVSPYMLSSLGAKYIIIGHSDNRLEGDTNLMIKNKVLHALNNKLRVIFCIGENKRQKKNKLTFHTLKKQIVDSLDKKMNHNKIIVAYEPIWSIGTGKIPSSNELLRTTVFIKNVLRNIFKLKDTPAVLYGGSVDATNIAQFKTIDEIDGFLIGGASKSPKKFIDIIKNYYR